jgi:CHASE1-domain containing sensor protein
MMIKGKLIAFILFTGLCRCGTVVDIVSVHDPEISREAELEFERIAQAITQTIQLSWRLTLTFPEFVVANLIASPSFPRRGEFEAFAAGNPYWNPLKTILEVQWVPFVSDRSSFEFSVREQIPEFMIFTFSSSGKVPALNHSQYGPITYCSPMNNFILGLDLYNDPIEGPLIREAEATGRILSAPPFPLRGLPDGTDFKQGTTVYMPLFILNASSPSPAISIQRAPGASFLGCVVTVIHFHPLVARVLAPLGLRGIDVFLFDPPPNASSPSPPSAAAYVAHYESPPADSRPALSPAAAAALRPEDIAGDLVTAFAPAWDVPTAGGRALRVLVRARAGSYPRDAAISARSPRCARPRPAEQGAQQAPWERPGSNPGPCGYRAGRTPPARPQSTPPPPRARALERGGVGA